MTEAAQWLLILLLALGALSCALRARREPARRAAWNVFAVAIAASAVGHVLEHTAADAHVPVVADVLCLAFYPLAGVALALVAAPVARSAARQIVIDGTVAALAVAATASALVGLPSLQGLRGGTAEVATAIAILVLGGAAWAPTGSRGVQRRPATGALMVPVVFVALLASLLVWDHFDPLPTLSVALAGPGLILAVGRMFLTARENAQLSHSRHEAMTDPLTGLGNRRRLMRDLADSLQAARGGAPRVLLLFDLDGFKDYNDTYGHPAGDALLARASGALSVAVASCGEAYRIGGDEFCVLGSVETTSQEALQAAAAAALSDHGEGFSISASCGAARLGGADDPASALRRADRELYRHKRTRSAASRQMVDVLLRALAERQPALVGPAPAVSGLAGAVAGRLGLAAQDAEEVMRAAKLRDVGKLGIPDGILGKAGPLTPEEQAFIREHTIIGERILTVAPALMGVGRIVRASHERWDGAGYPDGLAGDAIPLGARIIGACDAYVAMTSPRPHREAIPREAALAALRAGAGGQFDPVVVAALVAEIDRSAQPDLVAAAA